MHAIIVGSAAGGGFPQWNCACANCTAVRQERTGLLPRTQDSVALVRGERVALLNASPEIVAQIQRTQALWPRSARHSPIGAIVLTNGDLDHVLGLFSLRESQPLAVYATRAVWAGLEQSTFIRTLRRFEGQLVARTLDVGDRTALADAYDRPLGIELSTHALPGKRPVHLPGMPDEGDNIAVVARDIDGGKSIAYATACARLERLDPIAAADVVLFDGTFFRDDELIQQGLGKARAADMAHVPVEQSLAFDWAAGRRIFTHINNSNPMLDPVSDEAARVEAAGWEVAFDGMEIPL